MHGDTGGVLDSRPTYSVSTYSLSRDALSRSTEDEAACKLSVVFILHGGLGLQEPLSQHGVASLRLVILHRPC
eukprot:55895-Eustigmatos_ZCMA.PRE.1